MSEKAARKERIINDLSNISTGLLAGIILDFIIKTDWICTAIGGVLGIGYVIIKHNINNKKQGE
ncbi:MAG: hypothetical protein J6P72_09710 [Firmicutes bacterium]|nr:hypothetical protein [Bacillota bacterium]